MCVVRVDHEGPKEDACLQQTSVVPTFFFSWLGFRDRSLITGRGATKWGAIQVSPPPKKRKGHEKLRGSFNMGHLLVLAILILSKRGNKFLTHNFPIL